MAGFGELALQHGQIGDAVLGIAGQTRAHGVGANALGLFGRQKELAGGGEVQRCMAADGAHHLHARALGKTALHIHDLVALAHAQVDRLLRGQMQATHRQQGHFAHVDAGLHEVAQLQEAHAQAVAARFGSVHKAADGQVIEDAMCGGRVQAGDFAQLFQRHRLLARGEYIQQCEHAL
ncbi:hypothetical protein D3C72_1533160 [compost metagenome]